MQYRRVITIQPAGYDFALLFSSHCTEFQFCELVSDLLESKIISFLLGMLHFFGAVTSSVFLAGTSPPAEKWLRRDQVLQALRAADGLGSDHA